MSDKTSPKPHPSGFKAPITPLINSKTKKNDINLHPHLLTPSSRSPRSNVVLQTSIKKSSKNLKRVASGSSTDDEITSEDEDEVDFDSITSNNSLGASTISTGFGDKAESDSAKLGFEIKGIGESGKPPYSYATLIGMSILTSDEKKLTLAQIYNWISKNFKYYKKGDVGWQNSIRHNLSLNKAFTKSEKSKDGKGHFWQIEPGMESTFIKGKTSKTSTKKTSNKSKKQAIISANTSVSITSSGLTANKSKKDLAKVYQDLTPSSTFQQDDEDVDEDLADITDPLTESLSDEEDAYQGGNKNHNILSGINRTPKSQVFKIRSQIINSDDEDQPRKSRRLFEEISYEETDEEETEDSDDFDEENNTFNKHHKENIAPSFNKHKKQKLSKNLLANIPTLQAPSSSWSASAKGDSVTFHSYKSHRESRFNNATNTPNSSGNNNNHQTFMSSFNSDFELSPIRRVATGPILEPITPGNHKDKSAISLNSVNHSTIGHTSKVSVSNHNTSTINNNVSHNHSHASISSSSTISSTTSSLPHLSNASFSTMKTPNRMKTPTSASIMRKIWNSPTYLDDFYTSPSHSHVRASIRNGHTNNINSGEKNYKSSNSMNPNSSPTRSHTRFNRLNKSPHRLESSIIGNISTGFNDYFGVDICSVVKRAVESAVEEPDDMKN